MYIHTDCSAWRHTRVSESDNDGKVHAINRKAQGALKNLIRFVSLYLGETDLSRREDRHAGRYVKTMPPIITWADVIMATPFPTLRNGI